MSSQNGPFGTSYPAGYNPAGNNGGLFGTGNSWGEQDDNPSPPKTPKQPTANTPQASFLTPPNSSLKSSKYAPGSKVASPQSSFSTTPKSPPQQSGYSSSVPPQSSMSGPSLAPPGPGKIGASYPQPGLFGSSPQPGSSLFGNPPNPQHSSLFGASTTQQPSDTYITPQGSPMANWKKGATTKNPLFPISKKHGNNNSTDGNAGNNNGGNNGGGGGGGLFDSSDSSDNGPSSSNPSNIPPPVLNPRIYNKTFSEHISDFFFGDPDIKWGPFYPWTRAARRSNVKWKESTMDDMWNEIPPNTAQKKNASAQSASPFNLVKEVLGDSRPSQIDFAAWFGRAQHPRDYNDQFYAENFKVLYDRTAEFAQKWFGAGVHFGQYVGPNGSGWSAPLTEQFLQYSRLVAHEDRPRKTWASIINEPEQRKWLVVGILSQIMEKKIFNELLFGANKFFQDELERHDLLWIRREGYTRKEGRANIARSVVDGELVPDNFWNSVDDLTGQTVLIFRPLLDLISALRPSERWRRQSVFWQELHILLAFAGYLQVCTAISPSVFHFLSATPGARMDYALEYQADMSQYRDSKFWHEREEKKYQKGLDALARGYNANLTELQQLSGLNKLPSTKEERNTDRYHRTRGAKVKFAVFPKVTRYQPENIGVDLPVDQPSMQGEYEESEGQRISDITRCIVVYYQGLIYPRPNQTDGVPIETHLNEVSAGQVFFGLPSLFGLQRGWDWQGSWGWQWEKGPRLPKVLGIGGFEITFQNILIAIFLVSIAALFVQPEFRHDINNIVEGTPFASTAVHVVKSIQEAISPSRDPVAEQSYYSSTWQE